MTAAAYYNEIDPNAAAWLRQLIAGGHIAPGDVDERSITEVQPDDLRPYGQCHFFAGIAGWSYALRLAGIPDDRPVLTGSAPCQPFSQAGSQRGSDDERHLWPAFFRLIRECRPGWVVGEQVAGAAGLAWLDHVQADLEDAGYAAAAANLCAAGAGAPHIRQRLYWVAYADSWRLGECRERDSTEDESQLQAPCGDNAGGCVIVGNHNHAGLEGRRVNPGEHAGQRAAGTPSPWNDLIWLPCTDGKARPAQSGIQPLAHGLPKGLVRGGDRSLAPDANESAEARVMRIKGYGNAIVPPLAALFIRACMD